MFANKAIRLRFSPKLQILDKDESAVTNVPVYFAALFVAAVKVL
jgi:hypothetical protein